MSKNSQEIYDGFDPVSPERNMLAGSVMRLKKDLEHDDETIRAVAFEDVKNPDPEWLRALEMADLDGTFRVLQKRSMTSD